MMDIETLAKELHEAGREAVEKGATVAAEKFGEDTRVFLGWDEITETAREGRRIQAMYLLDRYDIEPKTDDDIPSDPRNIHISSVTDVFVLSASLCFTGESKGEICQLSTPPKTGDIVGVEGKGKGLILSASVCFTGEDEEPDE